MRNILTLLTVLTALALPASATADDFKDQAEQLFTELAELDSPELRTWLGGKNMIVTPRGVFHLRGGQAKADGLVLSSEAHTASTLVGTARPLKAGTANTEARPMTTAEIERVLDRLAAKGLLHSFAPNVLVKDEVRPDGDGHTGLWLDGPADIALTAKGPALLTYDGLVSAQRNGTFEHALEHLVTHELYDNDLRVKVAVKPLVGFRGTLARPWRRAALARMLRDGRVPASFKINAINHLRQTISGLRGLRPK